VAAMRLFREMVLADRIIDRNELLYLEAFCQPYNPNQTLVAAGDSPLFRFDISNDDVLESQGMSLAKAFSILKGLRKKELKAFGSEGLLTEFYANTKVPNKNKIYLTKNFVRAYEALSMCDGSCDIAEAKLCVMLNYILRKEDSFAFSNPNGRFRFSKRELMYFNPTSDDNDIVMDYEYDKISRRIELFGMNFVSLPLIKKELTAQNTSLEALLSFVYPSLFVKINEDCDLKEFKHNRLILFNNAINSISEKSFIRHIFGYSHLEELKRPFALVKVGRSSVQSGAKSDKTLIVDDFICIPLSESIEQFCDELTDDMLVLAKSVDCCIQLNSERPLVIKGFIKTILDYAVYLASSNITEIEIDVRRCTMSFGGIIPEVRIPARSLATYILIASVSLISEKGLMKSVRTTHANYNLYKKMFQVISSRFQKLEEFLDLDSKHVTSNLSAPLAKSKFINDISSLVPKVRYIDNEQYVSIERDTLKLIRIRFESEKYGLDGKNSISLELFVDGYLLRQTGLKRSDFS